MTVTILKGDCRSVLATLPAESVHCVVTSPPYWGLRDYGVDGQIGLETDPDEYKAKLVFLFRQIERVLKENGTVWLNLGDGYASNGGGGVQGTRGQRFGRRHTQENLKPKPTGFGLKPKDLIGLPWRVALALQADGWWLRQDIIWSKPNPMPESVTDRCTKSHEYLFLLSKSEHYYYDADAIREPGSTNSHGGAPNQGGPKQEAIGQNHGGRLGVPARGRERGRPDGAATFEKFGHNTSCGTPQDGFRNRRSVWEIATQPFPDAHFATFPPALIEPCILAGCPKGGMVLDPFGGAGTTGLVADRLGRNAILIELNPEYADMAERRIRKDAGLFADVTP